MLHSLSRKEENPSPLSMGVACNISTAHIMTGTVRFHALKVAVDFKDPNFIDGQQAKSVAHVHRPTHVCAKVLLMVLISKLILPSYSISFSLCTVDFARWPWKLKKGYCWWWWVNTSLTFLQSHSVSFRMFYGTGSIQWDLTFLWWLVACQRDQMKSAWVTVSGLTPFIRKEHRWSWYIN